VRICLIHSREMRPKKCNMTELEYDICEATANYLQGCTTTAAVIEHNCPAHVITVT